MLKFFKGLVLSMGCLLTAGVVAMVMAGNDAKAGVGITLCAGIAIALIVFLRTVFGADAWSKKQRPKSNKSNPFLNPGAEEWGSDSSAFSDPHGW